MTPVQDSSWALTRWDRHSHQADSNDSLTLYSSNKGFCCNDVLLPLSVAVASATLVSFFLMMHRINQSLRQAHLGVGTHFSAGLAPYWPGSSAMELMGDGACLTGAEIPDGYSLSRLTEEPQAS